MTPDAPYKTVNIAILEQDRFFILGLENMLVRLFERRHQARVVFHYHVDATCVAEMDIIILAMNPGDHIDCLWPWLAQRKLHSVVVGFYEQMAPAVRKKPLYCFEKALWLHKRSDLSLTEHQLSQRWRDATAGNAETEHRDCARCSRLKLTAQQRKIAFYMIQGYSNIAIASALNINAKTVSVHKYFLMEKLHLQTNQQFIHFLHRKNSVVALSLDS